MRIVLDSSATLAWIYGDEQTNALVQLFDRIAADGALVPSLWRVEVGNALTMALRRSRIEAEFRDAALRDLALLDIIVDPGTETHAWTSSLELADRFRLTLYDATYLDLAQRHSLPLASLEGELCAAARAIGIELPLG